MEHKISSTNETGDSITLCLSSCEHNDCRFRHVIARSMCRLCKRTIGYNLRFHRDYPKGEGFIHSDCLAETLPETRHAAAPIQAAA